MALPYHLYAITTQVPNMPLSLSFATAFVLIALIFIINLASIILRAHFRKKKVW
jgi:phosphate transport system permease protein